MKSSTPIQPQMSTMTIQNVLFFGLLMVGFGEKRQRVREQLSNDRFMSFFGPEPWTTKDILYDLAEEFPSITFKDVMMTMNWAKRCKCTHFYLWKIDF